jgi:hypothetical protein
MTPLRLAAFPVLPPERLVMTKASAALPHPPAAGAPVSPRNVLDPALRVSRVHPSLRSAALGRTVPGGATSSGACQRNFPLRSYRPSFLRWAWHLKSYPLADLWAIGTRIWQ